MKDRESWARSAIYNLLFIGCDVSNEGDLQQIRERASELEAETTDLGWHEVAEALEQLRAGAEERVEDRPATRREEPFEGTLYLYHRLDRDERVHRCAEKKTVQAAEDALRIKGKRGVPACQR